MNNSATPTSPPLRILLFSSMDLNLGSGSEVRARLISRGLKKCGAEVMVAALGIPTNFAEWDITAHLLRGQTATIWKKELLEAAIRFKPDIIYGVTEAGTYSIAITAKAVSCKFAYDLHGIGVVEILELGFGHGSMLRRLAKSIQWLAQVPKADLVTSANPTLTPVLAWLNPHTIPVVGMADTQKFSQPGASQQLGTSPDRIQVLYAGNFFKWQGLALLIKAIDILNQQPHNFEFTIIGSVGKNLNLLKSWHNKYKLEHVNFLDAVDYLKIDAYYRGADVLVIPRPFMLSTYLALPQKITEYMAAGKTIIATNLASHRWALGGGAPCGILCPPNPEGIAEGIKQSADAELRRILGQNARRRSQQWFDYIPQCEKIYQAFQKLLV